MVIRKPVYEVLPYAYMLVGVLLVLLLDNPLIYISGALLYIAGAAVWVMRSAYRRKNSHTRIANRKGRVVFPQWLYEALPFVYLALGVLCFIIFESVLGLVPGVALVIAGALVWLIRAIYRSQSPTELGAG